MKKIFFLTSLFALLFSTFSCDNNRSSNDLKVSRVNYINALNGNTGMNVLVNNTKINATPLMYKTQRGYANVESGTLNLKMQTSTTTPSLLVESNNPVGDFKNYTVFTTGSVSAPTAPVENVMVEDDLTAPQTGNFRIRVAQMVSNATPIDIEIAPVFTAYVKSTNTPVSPAETYIVPTSYQTTFSALPYKTVSPFNELAYTVSSIPTHSDPTKVYKATGIFSVRVKSGSTIKTFASANSITPGRNLTLLLSGLVANIDGTFLGN